MTIATPPSASLAAASLTLAIVAPQTEPAAGSQLDRICTLTERLIDVIEQETGLLRAIRGSETGPLLEEKARLTTAYEAESQLLKAIDRAALLDDGRMPELVHVSARLAEATAENEAALRFFMTLNSSVMQVIARSATASAAASVPQTYGSALQTRYNRTRPVAVNTAF